VARQYTGSAQDHDLPDRRFRGLRSRNGHAFIDRDATVSSEGRPTINDRLGSHSRAPGTRICDPNQACDENDRKSHSRGCPIRVGCWRYGLRWRRHSNSNYARQAQACDRKPLVSSAHYSLLGARQRRAVAGAAADIARPRHRVRRLESACPQEPGPKDAAPLLVLSRIGRLESKNHKRL